MIGDLFGEATAYKRPSMPSHWTGRAELSGVDRPTQRPVYRWSLSRTWAGGRGRCAFLLLNPSTANAELGDPTTTRCVGFAYRWGFEGVDLVNLYPFRASSPAACRRWVDFHGAALLELEAMRKNLAIIWKTGNGAALRVVAFGEGGAMSPEILVASLEAFAGAGDWGERAADLHCLGLTLAGIPKHPMARGRSRVPDRMEPELFYSGGWSRLD